MHCTTKFRRIQGLRRHSYPRFQADAWAGVSRDAKVKLLECVETVKAEELVLGQYVGGGGQKGYLEDPGVPKDSKTPTFAMCVMHIDNDRWRGVPFIVKAGKVPPFITKGAGRGACALCVSSTRRGAARSWRVPQVLPGSPPSDESAAVLTTLWWCNRRQHMSESTGSRSSSLPAAPIQSYKADIVHVRLGF